MAVSRKETRFVTHKRRRSVKGSLSCSSSSWLTLRRRRRRGKRAEQKNLLLFMQVKKVFFFQLGPPTVGVWTWEGGGVSC